MSHYVLLPNFFPNILISFWEKQKNRKKQWKTQTIHSSSLFRETKNKRKWSHYLGWPSLFEENWSFFHRRPAHTFILVYFHRRPAHTYLKWSIFTGNQPIHSQWSIFTGDLSTHSHWSIFSGDLPTHIQSGLFSRATSPHTHTSLFSRATCPFLLG